MQYVFEVNIAADHGVDYPMFSQLHAAINYVTTRTISPTMSMPHFCGGNLTRQLYTFLEHGHNVAWITQIELS